MDNKIINMVSSSNNELDNIQIENRINEEIEWGISFQQNRNQEKQLVLATTESLEFPSYSPRKPRKRKIKHKRHKRAPVSPVVSERILFDRNTCTQKQYYDMLSQPRPKFHETEEKPVKSGGKPCSPRFEQLALPLKQRVLNTWQDYEDVLAPENILWLKSLLTREEGLAPKAAGKYFSKLDANKRKAKKKKLKEQRERNIEKPRKSKIACEIEGLSKDIVHFFADKMTVTVKYRHMMITEFIKDKLVANSLVKPYKRNKHCVAGHTLYEVLDQLSVWLETNMASLTDEDLEEDAAAVAAASDISTTVTSSSASSEADVLLRISEEMETASVITIKSSLEVEQETASIITEIHDLTEEKEPIEEEEETAEARLNRKYAEEDKDEAVVEVRTEPEDEVIQEEEKESVDLQDIIDELIDKAVEETESKVKEPETIEIIDDDATEPEEQLAEPEIIDVDAVEPEEQPAEPETIDLEATETKEPSVIEVIDVDADEGAPEVEEIEKPEPTVDKDGRMIVDGILGEYIASIDMEQEEIHEEFVPVESKLRVEEHSPDTTCCVAMKKWAIWLAEVARNTHSWCQWIQEVIAKIRFFAAVLKGDVKTADGKRRILYKEEWTAFKETLETDMTAWIQYNTHVRDLSEKIIANFQNKRVVCCPACLQEKLIVSEETAHEVGERLAEAIQKASYWRTWLEQVVDKARKLTSLEIELPTAPENYSVTDSALASYTSFDLIEIKPARSPSVESSDTSVYIIEEFQ